MKKFKDMPLWARISIWSLAGILSLILILMVIILCVWGNEISTVSSIKKIRARNDAHLDGDVYVMEVEGGFYLDEFVEMGGVSSDAELIGFITDNITKGVVDMGIDAPEIGCASFTAKTATGDALFARNYDFAKTNVCIVITEASKGRHASISTADLQFLGIDKDKGISSLMDKITCLAAPYVPLDGINDAGVSCGIYMTYQGQSTVATNQSTDKPDFTSTTLLRLILDYADSLDEAIEIASSYDLHDSAGTSYHYMVADSSGRSAILEWIGDSDSTDNDGQARKLVVTYNDRDLDIGELEASATYQAVTNFIVAKDYYKNSSQSDIKGRDRYDKLYEELGKVSGVFESESQAMELLELVGRRSWKNDDGNGCTVHSAIYNLTDKSMLWISNENFDDDSAIFIAKYDEKREKFVLEKKRESR